MTELVMPQHLQANGHEYLTTVKFCPQAMAHSLHDSAKSALHYSGYGNAMCASLQATTDATTSLAIGCPASTRKLQACYNIACALDAAD